MSNSQPISHSGRGDLFCNSGIQLICKDNATQNVTLGEVSTFLCPVLAAYRPWPNRMAKPTQRDIGGTCNKPTTRFTKSDASRQLKLASSNLHEPGVRKLREVLVSSCEAELAKNIVNMWYPQYLTEVCRS